MSEFDFTAKAIKRDGKSLIVEFWIQKVIADWGLYEMTGNQQKRWWEGRTDDNIADAVAIDPKSITAATDLGWSAALYGISQDTDVNFIVDVRQDGRELGRVEKVVTVKANKSKLIAGTITLEFV